MHFLVLATDYDGTLAHEGLKRQIAEVEQDNNTSAQESRERI